MTLAELQALFQTAVLAGDSQNAALIAAIQPSSSGEKCARLGVYTNAYRLRLAEYFDEDYPAVRAAIGQEAFAALVDAYIDAHPSRTRNARWFSTHLPEFMEQDARWSDDAATIGLARFERALTDAFDATDADAQGIEALASFTPEEWPLLFFSFHPSLKVLQLPAGVLDTYVATTPDDEDDDTQDDDAASEVDEVESFDASAESASGEPFHSAVSGDGVEAVAVWRANLELSYRHLDDDEFLALNEARAGKSFGDICQLLAFRNDDADPERVAQLLVNWFSEGMVTSVAKTV